MTSMPIDFHDRKKSIIEDLATCIYESDWAIYEENGKNHISSACFEVSETKNLTIEFIISTMEKIGAEGVIGFSEGVDQAVISLATIVGHKLGKPSFALMKEEDRPPLHISNSLKCSLLLSYVSNKDQLLEILELVEKQGGNVWQVIVLVDEDSQVESICKENGVEFTGLTTLSEILENVKNLPSADAVRIDRILDLLK